MTLYEYVCRSCAQTIQEFHPLGQAPATTACDCNAIAKRSFSRGEFLSFPGAHKQPKP